jgi:response regulator NasT
MSLKKRVYSVLVVSSAENFGSAMKTMLPESEFSPIVCSSSISEAQRDIASRSFDFVIINAPLSDDIGLRFAIDCSASNKAIVLLLIRSEIHAEVYDKVFESGVFTLPKPISPQDMKTALKWMRSARERLRVFEKKEVSINDKMQEIRLVNKAKWLLISKEDMLEIEAHKFIEKEAMNRSITKRELAQEIIDKYEC